LGSVRAHEGKILKGRFLSRGTIRKKISKRRGPSSRRGKRARKRNKCQGLNFSRSAVAGRLGNKTMWGEEEKKAFPEEGGPSG